MVSTTRFAARPTLTQYTEAAINAAVNRADPDNQVTRYAYDVHNRLRYTVDALGSVSEKRYDARGNVVTTVRWATRPALTQYSETAIAAALAAVPGSGNDEVTHLVYDIGDRLRFTIDALGSVSEKAYDALGNVIATTRFAARPPGLTSFTESRRRRGGRRRCAATPPTRSPASPTTRTAGCASRSTRSARSRKACTTPWATWWSTTRFATRPTLGGRTPRARSTAAVAPLRGDGANQTTRFAYDAQNRLRFTVDALGSVSESVYDALGNVSSTVRFAVRPPLTQLHRKRDQRGGDGRA